MYDLAIIGGGPAGVAAGVYASRKKLKTVVIAEEFGGQSVVSEAIENWIGTIKISGADLAKQLEEHLRAYAGGIVDIKKGERAENVEKTDDGFSITTGSTYQARTVLVTTGSHRRKLDVPGADRLEHKGLTYCASCDGPIFADQDVIVVGGGNAGFESAAQLLAYCKSVTLLHRSSDFKADPVTVKKVLEDPKMTALTNAVPTEVLGDKFVTGLKYQDKKSGLSAGEAGEEKTLDVTGIFVEIGSIPTTGFVKNVVELTEYGQVKVNPLTQATSQEGIWAAGDCTDGLYHQNNIAAGDAVKALEDIYVYLKAK